MDKKVIALSYTALLLCFSATGQVKTPIKKIHAYRQATIPGISTRDYDEKGNQVEKDRKSSFNYWIYLETLKSEKIFVADIWISGKRFLVKNEPVTKTPIERINYNASNGPDTVMLVPVTRQKVTLIYPSRQLRDSVTGSRYVSNLIKNSELVIGYFWKGKKYFAPLKAFVTLEPEAGQ